MSRFAANTLNHLRTVSALLRGTRAQATIDPMTLILDLRAGSRRIRFQPQFVFVEDARLHYTPHFEERVSGFIGWRPYFNKRWPIAVDKLAFKNYCVKAGVPTLPFWHGAPPPEHPPLIVKQRSGSFGEGIRGPFGAGDRDTIGRLTTYEYAEEFRPGRSGKAWYWDGELCAVEYCDPATLIADGSSTIEELLEAAAHGQRRALNHRLIGDYLRQQGLSFSMCPVAGERIAIDFRYSAPLSTIDSRADGNSNLLPEIEGTRAATILRQAGEACWNGIPDGIRGNTVFTLDFVEDTAGDLWFLEMNCNPMVHPDVYPAMFRSLFGNTFNADLSAIEGSPGSPAVPPVLDHLKALRSHLLPRNARATIDAADLVMRIDAEGRAVHLQPRFLRVVDGKARVTHTLTSGINSFAGWLPCLARRWSFIERRDEWEAFLHACGLLSASPEGTTQRTWFWNGQLLDIKADQGTPADQAPTLAIGQRIWHGLALGNRIDTLFAVNITTDVDGVLRVAAVDPDPVVPPTLYLHLLPLILAKSAAARVERVRVAEVSPA